MTNCLKTSGNLPETSEAGLRFPEQSGPHGIKNKLFWHLFQIGLYFSQYISVSKKIELCLFQGDTVVIHRHTHRHISHCIHRQRLEALTGRTVWKMKNVFCCIYWLYFTVHTYLLWSSYYWTKIFYMMVKFPLEGIFSNNSLMKMI